MVVKFQLVGANGIPVKTTENGELVTAPLHYSDPYTQDLGEVNTAYNFLPPKVGMQFVITGAVISGNRNIGNDGSNLVVYGADSAESLTVLTDLIDVEVPKSTIHPFVVPNVVVPEGEFINGKCDDDDVKVTLYGYFVKKVPS